MDITITALVSIAGIPPERVPDTLLIILFGAIVSIALSRWFNSQPVGVMGTLVAVATLVIALFVLPQEWV